jgi:hypothetical protein
MKINLLNFSRVVEITAWGDFAPPNRHAKYSAENIIESKALKKERFSRKASSRDRYIRSENGGLPSGESARRAAQM